MAQESMYPNLVSGSATGTGWAAYGDATLQTGDVISVTTSDTNPDAVNAIMTPPFPATSGKSYTLTADIKATANFGMISGRGSTGMVSLSVGILSLTGFDLTTDWSHVSVELTPSKDASDARVAFLATSSDGSPASLYVRDLMLVEGTTPAAWAPAEGETLAGGGALMSANLLDGITPMLRYGATAIDGGWQLAAYDGDRDHQDQAIWDLAGQSAVEANQTMTASFAIRGDAAMANAMKVSVGYKDGAGNLNWYGQSVDVTTGWEHAFATLVVPAGMTPTYFYTSPRSGSPAMQVANVSLRFGGRQTLASDSHTPYATQDHVAAEYATKAALKVTSDAVTAEVTERGKLAGRVGTLESTTGTHTSKLQQLAASITSLVKGESTYTDPDGASATSGIYSLITQTRDSVTALFGDYTKTADLASTDAVRDAKKAGTDAAATANATATMIRQYSGGVLVAKTGAAVGALVNANGSFDVVTLTWANGVPSVSGTLSSFDADSADIGTSATPGAAVNLLGGAARFYVKQWDASDDGSREVRINASGNGSVIVIGPEDEATNGGLIIRSDSGIPKLITDDDPYPTDAAIATQWPLLVQDGMSIGGKAVKWKSAAVTLNTSSSLLGSHSASCLINSGLGLAYLAIDMSFESPGWQPGTGTWLFRLPSGLRPSATKRLYNLLQIYIGGRWGAHVDVHSDGYCYPTWGWQATNIMCNLVFPLALLGL